MFSWFTFTLYQFAMGITGQIVYFTDVLGSVGLGFKTTAGLMALVMVVFALFRRVIKLLNPDFIKADYPF